MRNVVFDFIPVELLLRNEGEGCLVCSTLRLQWKFPYLEWKLWLLRNVFEGESELCALLLRSLFLRGELEIAKLDGLLQQSMQFWDSVNLALLFTLELRDFILLQALKNPSTDATTNFSS